MFGSVTTNKHFLFKVSPTKQTLSNISVGVKQIKGVRQISKIESLYVFPEFNLFPQNKIFCNITKSFFGRQIRPKMLKQFQKIGKKYSYQIFVKYGMVGKATVCFGNFTLEGGGLVFPKVNVRKVTKY